MNKKFFLTLAVAGAVGAGFAAKKDPVVMRVAGRDVPRSEFEYLYNKNAGQQLEQQSLDEYAELFKVYKLKVADALDQQLDTAAAFKKELRGYAVELAEPYMVDSAYYKTLLHDLYDRAREEVQVSHIMFFKPREYGGSVSCGAYLRADSVLNELRNGAEFADLAARFSQDRASAAYGGSMGYITVGQTPYDFETAAYTLKEGEISGIIESPVGLHILKGGKHRPARGTVEVLHILKLVPDAATPERQAQIKQEIDSIYELVTAPDASFEAVASKLSDDRASARQGGNVGWFGTGRMLPEFDSASFALANGEISEPVRTRAGWHIIKKLNSKPLPSFAELEPDLRQIMDRPQGSQSVLLYSQFCGKLRKKYHFRQNNKLYKDLLASAGTNGVDSTFLAKWKDNNETLASWDGTDYKMSDFISHLSRFAPETAPGLAPTFVKKRFDNYVNDQLYRRCLDGLADENESYRNLLGEYRDGMLLFEVSNRNVWERAANDTEGLEQFFRDNRADYSWQTPHVKGFLVQAPSDSVAKQVQEYILPLRRDEVVDSVRANFPMVKIDEMLVAKGDNMLIDALAFTGEPVQNPDSKYPAYFMSHMRVITEPEEAADVRGQVTADYQNELERRWVDDLRARFPIEVFPKELSKVKSHK